MVKLNYSEVAIDHIVEFSKDNTVFAAARYNGAGHLYLFLITDKGNVYQRNGRAESWEELAGSDKGTILSRITSAKNARLIPVYRVNGSPQLTTGGSTALTTGGHSGSAQ